MRYYLDTTSLRKLKNELQSFNGKNIFTSNLALFELVSGMEKKDYKVRKSVIKSVIKSGIDIDWDSYKMKMHKAVGLSYSDTEGHALKEMINTIVESSSFDEVKAKKIYISNYDYYMLESFSELDDELSQLGIGLAKEGIQEWRKELDKGHRAYINEELFNNSNLLSFVRTNADIACSQFVQEITNTIRPSEEYFIAIEKYLENSSLNLYFYCSQLQFSLAQLKGELYAKNDAIDTLHTIYMMEDDIIVSDDNIFKKLGKWYPQLKSCTVDEFLQREEN